MELIRKPPILLSNFEVLSTLKEIKKNSRSKDQRNLATVTYEAIRYLEETPCTDQQESYITNFLMAIKDKGLRLTKAEKLQIVNSRPKNPVELQLLIEESEERFSEESLNLILSIIDEHLPLESSKMEDENDADEDKNDTE